MAVIGPDGNPIFVESIVPHVSGGSLVGVLDSGFTYSQVPRTIADAIYGRVQGANYSTDDGMCNDITSTTGNNLCRGSYQPISTAFSMLGHYDMILGMNSLRNFYTLFDYGNFVSNTTNDRGDPYVQLLSVTDPVAALADFVKESHSPISSAERKQHLIGAITRNWPYILIGRRKNTPLFNKNPYQAIYEPAPPAMHMRPINTGAYGDPHRHHS
ncbi:hypothetical protein F5148DRAFT_1350817 [Russula earlei]|uniref:Uncharacterized protein n=1 Tax=Russula earlei TaxID=71964 RepID=A0ACC0UDE8_9AGAM|nr:hypothetical protein F5148DRAFT_1350817 [Russula earlei]